jgi:hypothetical protein
MKAVFGCAVAVLATMCGSRCGAQEYVSPPPGAFVAPAIVYQTPVVYQAPVIYQAPVLYQAPVVYAPVQTYGAAEVCQPTATIVYVGGPCPRTEAYYNNCGPSCPVIYFGGGQARREGYSFGLRR